MYLIPFFGFVNYLHLIVQTELEKIDVITRAITINFKDDWELHSILVQGLDKALHACQKRF
jgi:hypothetical protein